MKTVKVVVKRDKIEKIYHVPYIEKMRVLDSLFYIQENKQPDLAFRWNCGEGVCGSCAAEVNGKPVLMCKMEVTERMEELNIKPLKVFPIIKDLVTDPKEVYEKLSQLKPFYTGGRSKELITIHDAEIKETQEMRKCIDCFICYDSCHVIRNHPNLAFPGPMNIVKAVGLDKHPHEQTERSNLLDKEGLRSCNVTRCCSENCPQKIKITEDAIIWAKERAVSLRRKQKK